MKFTLFETQGALSEEAITELTFAVNTFLNTQLADFFKPTINSFQEIRLIPRAQSSITKHAIAEEPVRFLRQNTRGTEIIFGGTIEFLGHVPSPSEIADVVTVLVKGNNDDLVSDIVNTGNSELGIVYVVLVGEEDSPQASRETPGGGSQSPSSSPSAWSEHFLRNPNGIVEPGKGEFTDEEPDTVLVIMAIAGVGTLVVLLFIFATRSTRNDRGASNDIVEDRPEMVVATSAHKSPNISGDLNEDAQMSIVSSVTDWNDYADNVTENVNKEGNEVELNHRSGMLPSAAAINCTGTMTLDKEEDNSVIPKSWMNALHGDNLSIETRMNALHGDTSPIASQNQHVLSEASSDDDSISGDHRGGFPQYNDGAFPTQDSISRPSCCHDWSHIGTVTEDEQSPSHDIVQTFSQETFSSKSSLNQFISDLVWLEKKIADGNEGSQRSIADSYSYDCDAFSPRSLSDEDSSLTSDASTSNSQAMSIVCRDCYIPPGNLDIEITSTKDGPVIKSIGDRSLDGHLNVGDLIMALDDRDTRSLSADAMATELSSRVNFQRKLTLLHFGGTKT